MMQKDDTVIGVIPARIGSSRLARKPLQQISEKSLIEHVWRQCLEAQLLDRLVIATDSEEVFSEASSFGAEVVMTSADIPSGSDRAAACCAILAGCPRENPSLEEVQEYLPQSCSLIVNIQGDMPFIKAQVIDESIEFFRDRSALYDLLTIATSIRDLDEFRDPSTVKVVCDQKGRGMYFSRSGIPYERDGMQDKAPSLALKHFGLYLYKPEILSDFIALEQSSLERCERLEQLRLLEAGYRIGVYQPDEGLFADWIDIDTDNDLEKARNLVQGKGE